MTRVLREIGLTVVALLGVAVLAAALAAVAFDVRVLVFRSGSMAPTIDTGDLGISRAVPAADIERGDVVTVTAASGATLTHRVVGIDPLGAGRVALHLRGDANLVPDAETYLVAEAPVLALRVPKAGYVVSWLGGPTGLPVLVGYGLLLGGLLLRRRAPEVRGSADARPGGSR